MKIDDLTAYPVSFPIPPDKAVTLGIGRAVKRDAVLIKVATAATSVFSKIANSESEHKQDEQGRVSILY